MYEERERERERGEERERERGKDRQSVTFSRGSSRKTIL